MQRIIVIGCPGSGKTTFAQRLRDATGLPLFYLDAVWHKSDKTHITRDEFDLRLGEILSEPQWIIDGNYSRTMERRMEACDTVILFDLPTEVCLDGAISRLGSVRPDMPWIETVLDPWLEKEIVAFPEKDLPSIYAYIEKYQKGRDIVIFKSREDADAFLRRLAREK